MNKQFLVDKIAMPLLVGVLTICASFGGMYLQSRMDRDRFEENLRREKLENILDLTLQVESGINFLPAHLLSGVPADGLAGERLDVPHNLRKLSVLTDLYFPNMAKSVDAFAQRAVLTLSDYENCFRLEAEIDGKKRCMLNGDPKHSTSSALDELLNQARREMGEIGDSP